LRFVFHALVTIVILFAAAALYIWSGSYNVASTAPHWDITIKLLKETRYRSIAYHSKGIRSPSLTDPRLIPIGFDHYHAMCRLCHGAPGYAQTEIALGLNPPPPELTSEVVQRLKTAELYWIIKNGIKMTGMPAFGPTYDEEELWAMVAFIRLLPKLNPGEYKVMIRQSGEHPGEEHQQGSKKE
jgi:mono/diheme cytochrome c family protein